MKDRDTQFHSALMVIMVLALGGAIVFRIVEALAR